MAVETTRRLGINRFPLGTDPYRREHRNRWTDQLELLAAIDRQGTLAARPATGTNPDGSDVGIRGTYYAVTDPADAAFGIIYRDTGKEWRTVGGVVDGLVSRPAAGVPGITVRLAAGATANPLEVRDSGDALLARVATSGVIVSEAGLTGGPSAASIAGGEAALTLASRAAGNRVAVIRVATAQTADGLQVQDSAGANLMRIGAAGDVNALAGLRFGRWPGTDTPGVELRYTDGGSGTVRNHINRHGGVWEWGHGTTDGDVVRMRLAGSDLRLLSAGSLDLTATSLGTYSGRVRFAPNPTDGVKVSLTSNYNGGHAPDQFRMSWLNAADGEIMSLTEPHGFLGLGTSNPQASLHVRNKHTSYHTQRWTRNSDDLSVATMSNEGALTVLSVTQTSRLDTKRDVKTVDLTAAGRRRPLLERIRDLKAVDYLPQFPEAPGRRLTSFVAEEADVVLPEVVSYDRAGKPEGINVGSVAVLAMTVGQHALDRLDALEARLAAAGIR